MFLTRLGFGSKIVVTGDNAPDASSSKINSLAGGQLHHAFHQVFFIADDDMRGAGFQQRLFFRAGAGHGDGGSADAAGDLAINLSIAALIFVATLAVLCWMV